MYTDEDAWVQSTSCLVTQFVTSYHNKDCMQLESLDIGSGYMPGGKAKYCAWKQQPAGPKIMG